MSSVRVLLCTCPPASADAIAAGLLERRLAACVNAIGGVISRYHWRGKVVKDDETLLLIKTEQDRVREVIDALRELHPYEAPELLSLPVEEGAEDYLRWVSESTAPPGAP